MSSWSLTCPLVHNWLFLDLRNYHFHSVSNYCLNPILAITFPERYAYFHVFISSYLPLAQPTEFGFCFQSTGTSHARVTKYNGELQTYSVRQNIIGHLLLDAFWLFSHLFDWLPQVSPEWLWQSPVSMMSGLLFFPGTHKAGPHLLMTGTPSCKSGEWVLSGNAMHHMGLGCFSAAVWPSRVFSSLWSAIAHWASSVIAMRRAPLLTNNTIAL